MAFIHHSIRSVFSSALVVVLAFASATALAAQAGFTYGSITGTVTDATGAAVLGAQVAILTLDGARIPAQAGENGAFRLADLASGSYVVEVKAPGFALNRASGVAVAVGRDTHLEIHLAPSQASEEVTVSAQTDALDVTQASPATNIDRDRIEELPIPSRNYLNFTLLVPSLAAANPAQQAPAAAEGGFSAAGLRPSSNALSLDGAEDDDEYTGMSRTELSPEAISDFQVVNHGYAAQYGGAAGGTVIVETRAGTATEHGDAFIFVQNGALNASPSLERAPRRADESRTRAGIADGGEWTRAKLFYYAAAEQESAHGEEAGHLDAATTSSINAALAQQGPLREFTLHEGFFPTTNVETEISSRLDRSFGRNSAMLRYAMTNSRAVNDAYHATDITDLSVRGSAFTLDHSFSGAMSTTLSSHTINQLRLQAAQRRVTLRTASQAGPGISVAGVAEFGTPFAGNEQRHETHIDAANDVISQRGKHLIAGGSAASAVLLRAANEDGANGLYVFPSLDSLDHAAPDFYLQTFRNRTSNFREIRTSAYAQDRWTVTPSLTLEYGLRWEYNHLPANLPQDAMNISPRMGFAWSGGRQWVVRGGFGVYFDRYLLSTINRIEQFNGPGSFMQITEGDEAAALYRAGTTYRDPQPAIAPSVWCPQPGMRNPYAETASLSVERAFAARWTAAAEYRHVQGVHLGRTSNINLPRPTVLTPANAASLGIANPTPQQIGRAIFAPARIDPRYDAVYQFQTQASSRYDGATFTANRQFVEDFELMAGYTLSATHDDGSSDTEMPQNPYDPQGERARSLQHQQQRFVLSGLYIVGPDLDDGPRATTSRPNLLQSLVYGLEFAPIVQVHSGFVQNALTGVDSNREHAYPFTSRPLGFMRNSMNSPTWIQADLRILKMIAVGRGHLDIVAESFNVLNNRNVDQLNTVYGSGATPAAGFGQPLHAGDARRIQFSLDFEY